MSALLEVRGLRRSFGALKVTDDVTFSVVEGEILGIIGPNGAGKTTLFALLAGNISPSGGAVFFAEKDITYLPAHVRARLGLARTYQVPRPFSHMTVFENLKVAALFAGGLEEIECADWVEHVLEMAGMPEARNMLAGSLPLLSRKRHELARALAMRPKLLLIDEVAAGLTDFEVDEFIALVRSIRETGITVVWIEHVMKTMLTATDRLMALAGGKLIATGKPQDVVASEAVRRVYLGA